MPKFLHQTPSAAFRAARSYQLASSSRQLGTPAARLIETGAAVGDVLALRGLSIDPSRSQSRSRRQSPRASAAGAPARCLAPRPSQARLRSRPLRRRVRGSAWTWSFEPWRSHRWRFPLPGIATCGGLGTVPELLHSLAKLQPCNSGGCVRITGARCPCPEARPHGDLLMGSLLGRVALQLVAQPRGSASCATRTTGIPGPAAGYAASTGLASRRASRKSPGARRRATRRARRSPDQSHPQLGSACKK